jgi:hypothetical protein
MALGWLAETPAALREEGAGAQPLYKLFKKIDMPLEGFQHRT